MGEYNKRQEKISGEIKDGTDISNKALLAHLQWHLPQQTVIIFLHITFSWNILKPLNFIKYFQLATHGRELWQIRYVNTSSDIFITVFKNNKSRYLSIKNPRHYGLYSC